MRNELNNIYKSMLSHVLSQPHCFTITKEDQISTIRFDQKATDYLVSLWKVERAAFVDEALDAAAVLFEDADEAIRFVRHDQVQVDELARSLGMRITEKVDDYANFLFNLEFGEYFREYVAASNEINS